jgi:Acyl-CoA dehydrogenase, C-terminal domain
VAAELLAGRLPGIASGETMVTLAMPPLAPFALDADVADVVLLAEGDEVHVATATGEMHRSLDPARRLFEVSGVSVLSRCAVDAAFDVGVLACAAQLVGLGRALLEVSVSYAKARHQFGRPIGEFQAVKHHLADALTELEFAQPLVYGAALSYGTEDFTRDVSAAKVAASEAVYMTAKIALQVHGAIGYTDEYDPSLLIRKARALYSAWGTPAQHRARVIAAL